MRPEKWNFEFFPEEGAIYRVIVNCNGSRQLDFKSTLPDISNIWKFEKVADVRGTRRLALPECYFDDEALIKVVNNRNAVEKCGEDLLKFLFNNLTEIKDHKVFGLFERALKTREGLEININVSECNDLIDVPWEALFYRGEAHDKFLAAYGKTKLVRTLPIGQIGERAKANAPLHLLVAISNPAGDLGAEAELKNIETLFSDVKQQAGPSLEYEVIKKANSQNLADNIETFKPHIIHYIGHSGVENGVGAIYLHDPNDPTRSKSVNSGEFANIVQNNPPWLVVLNSCESAITSAENRFNGLAQKLIGVEIPFVVAMQLSVLDDVAKAFSKSFYLSLSNGEPVAQAVSAGRTRILNLNDDESRKELIAPVFYSSGTNERIEIEYAPDVAATDGASPDQAAADDERKTASGIFSAVPRWIKMSGAVFAALASLVGVVAGGIQIWEYFNPTVDSPPNLPETADTPSQTQSPPLLDERAVERENTVEAFAPSWFLGLFPWLLLYLILVTVVFYSWRAFFASSSSGGKRLLWSSLIAVGLLIATVTIILRIFPVYNSAPVPPGYFPEEPSPKMDRYPDQPIIDFRPISPVLRAYTTDTTNMASAVQDRSSQSTSFMITSGSNENYRQAHSLYTKALRDFEAGLADTPPPALPSQVSVLRSPDSLSQWIERLSQWAVGNGISSGGRTPASLPPPMMACNPGPYIIFFDHEDAALQEHAKMVLEQAISEAGLCGLEMPALVLEGHDDSAGSRQQGMAISSARNQSVREYFEANGIAGNRITSIAFGESRPRVNTADGVREPQNRNVVIYFAPREIEPRCDTGTTLVFFNFDQAELTPLAKENLQSLASMQQNSGRIKVQIKGFFDAASDKSESPKLAVQRARETEKFLVDQGVSANMIQLLVSESACRHVETLSGLTETQNRRVEITVTPVTEPLDDGSLDESDE